MAKRHRVPWLSLDDAVSEVGALNGELDQSSDPRARIKLARRLAFAAASIGVEAASADLEQVGMGIAALQRVMKFEHMPENVGRSMSVLIQRRLQLLGITEVQVMSERSKVVSVDAACLAVTGGASWDPLNVMTDNKLALSVMNEGKCFLITTGADGRYRLSARWIDAPVPILRSSEYKRLEASTDIGVLSVETGKVVFGAAEDAQSGVAIDVPNGMVSVQVHVISSRRGPKYVLVLCRQQKEVAALTRIPELQC